MQSMWTATSDRDYYSQFGDVEEPEEEIVPEEPWEEGPPEELQAHWDEYDEADRQMDVAAEEAVTIDPPAIETHTPPVGATQVVERWDGTRWLEIRQRWDGEQYLDIPSRRYEDYLKWQQMNLPTEVA